MKSSYIKLIGPLVSLMLITGNVLGQSVDPPPDGLPQQLADLQVAVSNLQATVKALKTSNNDLSNRLQYVSLVGKDMYIIGANLHIESGSGTTYGPTNGLGNLIVGYNELRRFRGDINDRTGSHNIVVGIEQNFSSYGGLVAGVRNEISGPFSSVSGGGNNTASGESCSAGGGNGNTARGESCSVGGGNGNTASGSRSSVSGGDGNTASESSSSVSGGVNNTASGFWSSVSGGANNTASGEFSSVSGGVNNTASKAFSSVSGGSDNTASGNYSSVSGGGSLVQTNQNGWAGGSFHSP
jgi:hypothetical protein